MRDDEYRMLTEKVWGVLRMGMLETVIGMVTKEPVDDIKKRLKMFPQFAAVVIVLTYGVDVGLFYLFPIDGVEMDTNNWCKMSSAGCTFKVDRIQMDGSTVGVEYYPMVKYPLFSVAVHEHIHALGYHDEIVPYLMSTSITILIASVIGLIYFRLYP